MIHVDTNIVIDVLTRRPGFVERSIAALERIAPGESAIGPMVYAELAGGYPDRQSLDPALAPFGFVRLHMSDDALFLAGAAFRAYRSRGGTRNSC